MSEIEILPMGPHEFSVTVEAGNLRTTHRVVVPDDIRDLILDALPDDDEEHLVRESVEVLLEHKRLAELPHDFSLDWAAGQVPDLVAEVRTRLE